MKPKIAKEDFNVKLMPHNRRQVFKDVLRQHAGKFIGLGFMIFACSLPVYIYAVYEYAYQANVYASLTANATAEEMNAASSSLLLFNNLRYLTEIVFLVLLSLVLAGFARIVRGYAWEENVIFRRDFSLGVRQNGKQYALFGLCAGMLRFLCNYIGNVTSSNGGVYEWLGVIPTVICMLILLPALGYALVSASIYDNSWLRNLKIGFICYFRHPWKTLLAMLCCGALILFRFIPNIYCDVIFGALESLATPFIMLGWWLFAYNIFDKEVNPTNHPELVGRGTFQD